MKFKIEYDPNSGAYRVVMPDGLRTTWCSYMVPLWFKYRSGDYVAFSEYFGAERTGVYHMIPQVCFMS